MPTQHSTNVVPLVSAYFETVVSTIQSTDIAAVHSNWTANVATDHIYCPNIEPDVVTTDVSTFIKTFRSTYNYPNESYWTTEFATLWCTVFATFAKAQRSTY